MKRYGITFDEEIYRWMRMRAVEANQSVGAWITERLYDYVPEATMQDPIKKAIEPDEVKIDTRGNLSKGLGELPSRLTPKEMQAQKDEILRRISKQK